MARYRAQFLIIDLVAVVTLSGLAMAAVRFRDQPANFVGVCVPLTLVAGAWRVNRQIRTAPICEECGNRFLPPPQKPSPAACPRCGEPMIIHGRSGKPLIISFWAALAVLVLAVVSMYFVASGLPSSGPPSGLSIALMLALPVGLGLLLLVFFLLLVVRAVRESARPARLQCPKCATTRPTVEPEGPRVCPRCRVQQQSSEQVRKEQVKGWSAILALLGILACSIWFMVPASRVVTLSGNHWISAALSIGTTMVALVVALFGALVFLTIIRQRRFRSEESVVAHAEKCSGEPGDTVRAGAATIWCSPSAGAAPAVIALLEDIRERFEAILGREFPIQPPVRIVCFEQRRAWNAFIRPIRPDVVNWPRTLDGLYLPQPFRIIILCREPVSFHVQQFEKSAGICVCHYLMDTAPASRRGAWLEMGISAALTSEEAGLARLNRQMLSALSRGTVLGTRVFTFTLKDLAKQLTGWRDQREFALRHQMKAQSRSLFEFLCGKLAPAQRLEQVRAFIFDSQSNAKSDEAFERHFGLAFDEMGARWREWVLEQGVGEFVPVSDEIEKALVTRVIPLIEDRGASRDERILAIRHLGIEGHVLGAGALIDLLRGDDTIPREEVIWALEAISGMPYGDAKDRWSLWWQDLPPAVRDARCWYGEEDFTKK
jgi:ssDNA-binding Zn-finger/Zn-ribbon topoisomerase 1